MGFVGIKEEEARTGNSPRLYLSFFLLLKSDGEQFVEPLPPVAGKNATVIVEVFNAGSR